MDITGKWSIAAVQVFNEKAEKLEWLTAKEIMGDDNAEDYLKESLAYHYIFTEDGRVLVCMPVPKDATKEEIDEALSSGEITLYDESTMILEKKAWKEEDGKLYFDTQIKGEVLGEEVSSWQEIKETAEGIELEAFRLVRA